MLLWRQLGSSSVLFFSAAAQFAAGAAASIEGQEVFRGFEDTCNMYNLVVAGVAVMFPVLVGFPARSMVHGSGDVVLSNCVSVSFVGLLTVLTVIIGLAASLIVLPVSAILTECILGFLGIEAVSEISGCMPLFCGAEQVLGTTTRQAALWEEGGAPSRKAMPAAAA